MPSARSAEWGLEALSPEARDVVEAVVAGEHVTFEQLPPAVAREIKVHRHRRNRVLCEEPLPRVGSRGSCLGALWPRRHSEAILSSAFSLSDLGASQRTVFDSALEALRPIAGYPGMVLLVGPRGTGKTFIATALVQHILAETSQPNTSDGASYYSAGDLFAEQRRSFNAARGEGGTEPMERVREASILCIDEIQERSGSDWEQTELTRLMDYRYRECKPSILIGNLSLEALEACLGPSIISRFQETGLLIECEWESFRSASR